MRIAGEHRFAAPRGEVWRALIRPDVFARTMPGVERVEIEDDRIWTAHGRVRLGLVAVPLRVRFEKVEEEEPVHARLVARGHGPGATMEMQTSFELSSSDRLTEMRWTTEVALRGPFGNVGERLLRPLVARQVAHVLDSLDTQLGGVKP